MLSILAFLLLAPGARATSVSTAAPAGFVQASGSRFLIDGKPYHFVGANFWYGMSLGSPGPGGSRERLKRELDRLKALGADNLRIAGLTEGPNREPWRIVPAMQVSPGRFDKAQLEGLDYLLSEMAKRGQKAVVILNNFWPWSGGMAQYHSWSTREQIPYPPPEPGGDWDAYEDYTAGFYADRKAVDWSHKAIRELLTRRNSVTKVLYRDDPTIMAWELCNEPRGRSKTKDYNAWIDETASFIKSLDRHHLVTTGSEGSTQDPEKNGLEFARNHAPKDVDYATIHIWAQNWYWYDPASTATFSPAVQKMRDYLDWHAGEAAKLGKPLVVEEFGLARDSGTFEPAGATRWREAYYDALLGEAYRLAGSSGTVAGANFWSWSGEGRPPRPGGFWRPGDSWLGDPPHESQGGLGVYDTDAGTAQIVMRYAALFSNLGYPGTPFAPSASGSQR